MKANILVVDDERSIRDSLKMVLQEEGYEAQTAADGKEAMSLLEQNDYDILITDLKMPGMDGMELTKQCLQVYPQTSVIIITAYGSLETAMRLCVWELTTTF